MIDKYILLQAACVVGALVCSLWVIIHPPFCPLYVLDIRDVLMSAMRISADILALRDE
jgi:hypothetical protein